MLVLLLLILRLIRSDTRIGSDMAPHKLCDDLRVGKHQHLTLTRTYVPLYNLYRKQVYNLEGGAELSYTPSYSDLLINKRIEQGLPFHHRWLKNNKSSHPSAKYTVLRMDANM